MGSMLLVSPNSACPGLHSKPLDATIGQLLTPYCPSGCQGNSKQNNNKKITNFAGHSDACGGALVVWCMRGWVKNSENVTKFRVFFGDRF
jgi:hypothetical protein